MVYHMSLSIQVQPIGLYNLGWAMTQIYVAEMRNLPNCLRPKNFGRKVCGPIVNVAKMCRSLTFLILAMEKL